jgi:hypothetical protein
MTGRIGRHEAKFTQIVDEMREEGGQSESAVHQWRRGKENCNQNDMFSCCCCCSGYTTAVKSQKSLPNLIACISVTADCIFMLSGGEKQANPETTDQSPTGRAASECERMTKGMNGVRVHVSVTAARVPKIYPPLLLLLLSPHPIPGNSPPDSSSLHFS